MNSLLRLFFLILITVQSVNAKTSTENLIVDKSEIYDYTNSSDIEEGDFLESVPKNSSDYIWVVNLKNGPYASREEAIKAQLDLKKILDPTLTKYINEIFLDQKSNTTKTNSNDINIPWIVNLKLKVYKSKGKALKIIKKIEATQNHSGKILLTRESVIKGKNKLIIRIGLARDFSGSGDIKFSLPRNYIQVNGLIGI